MKIGYGTYGMPDVPVQEALPRLAKLGYEAVELCVGDRYDAAPAKLGPAQRQQVREVLRAEGLELAGLMIFLNLLAPDPEELRRQQETLRAVCGLARDLAPDAAAPPVIASTIGHGPLTWETAGAEIVARVVGFAAAAAQDGCRFALEPHIGGLLSEPGRVVWLMDRVRSAVPAEARGTGINFDISHFVAAGYAVEEMIRQLVPYSIHTHVKDGRMEDGKVRFLLPGEGDLDWAAYFRAMARAGWTGPINVEVTAQIFNQPEYDPWPAAEFSLATLREARRAAGVG